MNNGKKTTAEKVEEMALRELDSLGSNVTSLLPGGRERLQTLRGLVTEDPRRR